MLEQILGTSARVALLRILLSNSERTYSLNELARLAGLSPSTAFKEVLRLREVVGRDPISGRYQIQKTRLTKALQKVFEMESELVAGKPLFDRLSELGFYYISGTAALILRGLARDFTTEPAALLIVCDRKLSKLRGAITSLYREYEILVLEDRIRPADFTENEVYLKGRPSKANLAVVEKAIVDAVWKWKWEGESLAHAIYCLMERTLDAELMKRYAREKGPYVERHLKYALETVGRLQGVRIDTSGLARGSVERGYERGVEEAVERVLRS